MDDHVDLNRVVEDVRARKLIEIGIFDRLHEPGVYGGEGAAFRFTLGPEP